MNIERFLSMLRLQRKGKEVKEDKLGRRPALPTEVYRAIHTGHNSLRSNGDTPYTDERLASQEGLEEETHHQFITRLLNEGYQTGNQSMIDSALNLLEQESRDKANTSIIDNTHDGI